MPVQATTWLGLVVSPLLFLTNMQISFMLVPWVCGNGHQWVIHLVHAATLTLIVFCSVAARSGMRDSSQGQHFVAVLSFSMTAFVGVALLAHWIPNFLLGACE